MQGGILYRWWETEFQIRELEAEPGQDGIQVGEWPQVEPSEVGAPADRQPGTMPQLRRVTVASTQGLPDMQCLILIGVEVKHAGEQTARNWT